MASRPWILQRDRRHREPGVVGQQRDHAVDVVSGERGGEPRRDLSLPGRTRQRCPLPVRSGQPGRHRGPGPLQRAVHRGLAAVQHVRHLQWTEPEHVPEHEHGPLPRRQVLDGGHESQRDCLLGLISRLGTRARIRQPVQQHIRIGLQPQRLTPAGRLGGQERWPVGFGPRPAAAGPQRVQAPVGRDPVQPGAQRGPSLVLAEPPPGGQQGLLQHVFGVLHRTEDPVAVQLKLASVRAGQLIERPVVPAPRPFQRCLCHHGVLLHPYGHRGRRKVIAQLDRLAGAVSGV